MSESESVYRKVEVVGSSGASIEDAIQNAIARASSTLRKISWFETEKITGHIVDGKVAHYQVDLKIGFRLE